MSEVSKILYGQQIYEFFKVFPPHEWNYTYRGEISWSITENILFAMKSDTA